MSYNNYVDTDAARRAAYDHAEPPCVAIIKHANPCGIAVGADVAEAHRKAHACDPVSAFGGVIAVNRRSPWRWPSRSPRSSPRSSSRPAYEDGALEVLSRKKNIRLLVAARAARRPRVERRPIGGGAAAAGSRPAPGRGRRPGDLDARDRRGARRRELAELAFAWRACRAVKSNAILLAKDGATVGVGMGQVNRVDSAKLAVERAGRARRRLVRRLRRVLPVPRRARGPDRGRRQGRRPARRLGPRRAGRRGRAEGRRDDVLHRDAPLLPLTGTASHAGTRALDSHVLAGALAVVVGVNVAIQSRINGEFGHRIDDGDLRRRALVRNRPGLRDPVRAARTRARAPGSASRWSAIRNGGLRWWQLLGGLGGALFVASQSITVATLGVALFTVCVVAGQTGNSLVVDQLGLGPAGVQQLTIARAGAAVSRSSPSRSA